MSNFTDWRGTPIKEGSRIIYAVRVGSSLDVIEGIVKTLIPDPPEVLEEKGYWRMRDEDPERYEKWINTYYPEHLRYTLKVYRVRSTGWMGDKPVVDIKVVDRITVIP